ncbi:MAG TPA: hypothetical protein VGD69_10295 [Herpetosiphonaceae bacterium]
MAKDQIVIVTQMDDAHADDIILLLHELGHDAIRLNTDDIPVNTLLSLGFDSSRPHWSGSIAIQTNGRIIDAESIRSVWWRRPAAFGLPLDLSLQEREFATDEIDHALRSLWASLDCYWISYPENIRQASWKGAQLQRAAQLGFEVPRTIITTDPDAARTFYYDCPSGMIFKVMTDPFLGAQKMAEKHPDQAPPEAYGTSTTLVSEAELALLDSVRLVPCLFQEYIPKQLDLRVTVIGDELFAAEIHSQTNEQTRIDWRNYDVDIPYRRAQLPAEVAARCMALVKSYNLNFSAIDLILTPDGRYVFVENNPNGQFMFVEELVPELRMTEALAACLIRGSNG